MKVNEVSAIAINRERMESVSLMLSTCGVKPQVFDNVDAWVDQSTAYQKRLVAPVDERLNGGNDCSHEQCLLLVGSLSEIADRKLPEKINNIHPGLPVVVAGESPSKPEVVRLVRQGALDVIDLQQPDELCQTVQSAVSMGRETQQQRSRVLDLRARLENLTGGERQVLDAMMNGYANKETAKLLGIGLRTVELRRAKIMMKMGAKGVAELVKFFCEARCPGVDTSALN